MAAVRLGRGHPCPQQGTVRYRLGESSVESLRILLAEDESIIRMGLIRILEDAGHRVVAAPDGRTAVRLARQTGPDLAILDIKMPGLDGLQVAREIFSRRPLPIVLLTAYGDRELVEQAAELPIMAYLIKPVKDMLEKFGVFLDDSQVCYYLPTIKIYARRNEAPHATITLFHLNQTPPQP